MSGHKKWNEIRKTRDPVAALAASVDRFYNGDWEYAVRHGLAEQGYVLVNAEGLAAAMVKVRPYGANPGEWAKVQAAAILTAIQEQDR